MAFASTSSRVFFAKTFEKILDNRLRRWSDRVGALSDLQGGFRAGRCTLDQVFTLSEIARMHKEKSIPLYLGFIDVRKDDPCVATWSLVQASRTWAQPQIPESLKVYV